MSALLALAILVPLFLACLTGLYWAILMDDQRGRQ